MTTPDTDITTLTNEQLSELIYRLSLESRRAYDEEQRAIQTTTVDQLMARWEDRLKVCVTEDVDYDKQQVTINAKASVNSQEAISHGE